MRDIEEKYFGLKNENAPILFRAQRWYRWYFPFTCATSRNRDIAKTFFGQKNLKSHLLFRHYDGNTDTFLSPVCPPEFEISKKNILDWKTKMLAYCFGKGDGNVDTSFTLERPLGIEFSQKMFFGTKNENARILFRAPGWYLSTVRPQGIELLKENFLTEKWKCTQTVQSIGLVPLTPPFVLYDLQKSRYQIFWTEKRKYSHTIEGIGLVPFTCATPRNWYWRKIYRTEKRKCLITVQGNSKVPVTSLSLPFRNRDIKEKLFGP